MTTQHARPWYCSDEIVEEYRTTLTDGERLPMLKTLKIVRAILVNAGIISVSLYALYLGGDPTWIAAMFFFLIGGYNGVEYADYAALMQAYQEVQNEQ